MTDDNRPAYYENVREELIEMIEGTGLTVLEVGAGSGATLAALKRRGIARHTTAVEVRALEGHASHAEEIDELIIGDIETLAGTLPNQKYDLILCADVLEHLVDPWTTVRNLGNSLKADGCMVASIPNICYAGAIKRIFIDRDFRYENEGIFDRTHLRFFCKRNIVQLFSDGGFKIQKMSSTVDGRNRVKRFINLATLGLFYEYLVKQYFVLALRED